jgi:hypothetical protein
LIITKSEKNHTQVDHHNIKKNHTQVDHHNIKKNHTQVDHHKIEKHSSQIIHFGHLLKSKSDDLMVHFEACMDELCKG